MTKALGIELLDGRSIGADRLSEGTMIAQWPALDAVGARYTMSSRDGARLWDLPQLLKYVLARRGVAQPDLVRPLPPGGLSALLLRATNGPTPGGPGLRRASGRPA